MAADAEALDAAAARRALLPLVVVWELLPEAVVEEAAWPLAPPAPEADEEVAPLAPWPWPWPSSAVARACLGGIVCVCVWRWDSRGRGERSVEGDRSAEKRGSGFERKEGEVGFEEEERVGNWSSNSRRSS